MGENFDRLCLLIESVFRQAHADAHRGDPDALDFLALYGAQPQAQGHRVFVPYTRPRRKNRARRGPAMRPADRRCDLAMRLSIATRKNTTLNSPRLKQYRRRRQALAAQATVADALDECANVDQRLLEKLSGAAVKV